MAETNQSYSAEVDATVDDCIAVLLDFERYPDWSTPILEAKIEETDAEGRPRRVAFALDMRIRTIRYTLEYSYALPRRLTWELVAGDLSGVQGAYDLEPLPDGRSRATCTQEVDLGFWLPGPLRRMFERQALRDSVLELKAEIERRAGRG
ncbi:MAG: cyclase [Deltaproteobacteria bacterium]|nr:cyclase [Deltaproteobacteria bacterium]